MRPPSHIVIQVQENGVWDYDEDQIALVILDMSNFAARVPAILGTPTISHVVNMMKEKEVDALAMPWGNARVAHLLLVGRMTAFKVGDDTVEECSPDDYNQVLFTQNVETIEAFASCVVPVKVEMDHTGNGPYWRTY